jgi:hypothetical protein
MNQEAIDKLEQARKHYPGGKCSQKSLTFINDALAALQAPACATCGDSGEIDDTIHSVRAGIDINRPCPACQDLKKPPEPTVEKLADVLSKPDCQAPAPAGELTKRFREFLIEAYRGEAIPSDIYTQGLETCTLLDRQAQTIKILTQARTEQGERIKGLEAENKQLKDKITEQEKSDIFEIRIPNLQKSEIPIARKEISNFTKNLLNALTLRRTKGQN